MQLIISKGLFNDGFFKLISPYTKEKETVYRFSGDLLEETKNKAIITAFIDIAERMLIARQNNYHYFIQTHQDKGNFKIGSGKMDITNKALDELNKIRHFKNLPVFLEIYKTRILERLQMLTPSNESRFYKEFTAKYTYLTNCVDKLSKQQVNEQLFT